jgi:hypothetical protein
METIKEYAWQGALASIIISFRLWPFDFIDEGAEILAIVLAWILLTIFIDFVYWIPRYIKKLIHYIKR